MGAGLLLQEVLALYHKQDSQVFVDERGKPRIEGLEINLSHSGNLVICAVSEQPVGCDVEEVRKAPRGVAERYFSRAEQKYLNRFVGEQYDREFFRFWTMKESYVKMTGEGLRVLPNEQPQGCHLSSLELQGHIISICTEEPTPIDVVWKNI